MKNRKQEFLSLSLSRNSNNQAKIKEKVLKSQEMKQLKQKISLYLPQTCESPQIKRSEHWLQRVQKGPRQRAKSQTSASLSPTFKNFQETARIAMSKKIADINHHKIEKVALRNSKYVHNTLQNPKMILKSQRSRSQASTQRDQLSEIQGKSFITPRNNFKKYLQMATVKEIFQSIQIESRAVELKKSYPDAQILISKRLQVQSRAPSKHSFQEEVRQKILKFRSKAPTSRKRVVSNNTQHLNIKSNLPLISRISKDQHSVKIPKLSIYHESSQEKRKFGENGRLEDEVTGWTGTMIQKQEVPDFFEKIEEENCNISQKSGDSHARDELQNL